MSRAGRSGELTCLRCGGRMAHAFTENIQLGKTSVLFGGWPNLLAGAVRTEVYCCEDCGRLEFFAADRPTSGDIPQVVCPKCGKSHDFDYPRCPFCKHEYQ